MRSAVVNLSEIENTGMFDVNAWTYAKDSGVKAEKYVKLSTIAKIIVRKETGEEKPEIDFYCLKYGLCPEKTTRGVPVKKGDIVYFPNGKFYLSPVDGYLKAGAKIEPYVEKDVIFGVLKQMTKKGTIICSTLSSEHILTPLYLMIVPIPTENEKEKYKKIYYDELKFNDLKRKLAEVLEDID